MTTALDSVLGPLAKQFIEKFGTTVKYTSKTLSSYDATTGTVNSTLKNASVKAIIEAVNRSATTTGASSLSKQITIAAQSLPVAPTEGDEVVIAKVTYLVADVESSYSGDEVATYNVGLVK
jgi:hypothetical protein|tara:strand:+ start:563 stop:925 length:363 start_codon:yes stop_codon:yes gene_type:complete